jgi:FKBP-type peptidyl-prolyl cis-trans isomerase FkpA
LARNAKRAGIIVTDSGLQYEVLKNAEGSKPNATDTVTVNYLGTLLDRTEFDSSYSRNKPLSH